MDFEIDRKENGNNKYKRESNIELLRIIAMVLITIHHYAINTNLNNMYEPLRIILEWGGKVGVQIFLMISGYFLINSKFKIKKFLILYFEILFYSIVPVVIFKLLNVKTFTFREIGNYLFPILSKRYTFASNYIYLYLLSPFIVKCIKRLNKKSLEHFIFIVIILYLIRYILPNANLEYFNGIFAYIFFFTIGCYIRLYEIKFCYKEKGRNICILISMLLIYIFINMIFYKFHNFRQNEIFILIHRFAQFSMNSVYTLIFSILLFYVLKDTKVNYNIIINRIATATFAMFLIQEHPLLRDIWWKKIFNIDGIISRGINMYFLNKIVAMPAIKLSEILNFNVKYLLFLHCFCIVIFMFIIAVIIESFRKYIENITIKLLSKLSVLNNFTRKIDIWINE